MKEIMSSVSDKEILFSSVSEEYLSKYDTEAAYDRFRVAVASSKAARKNRILWLSCSAAAVSAFVVMSVLSFKAGQSSIESMMAEDIVLEAPAGSRSRMILPDGTSVWLNAGSTLSYSQMFGVNERVVRMVGEGYFEVSKNEDIPFSVLTDDLQVRVCGTKFNVRDYPSDTHAVVSLTEGSIALSALQDPLKERLLKPDQRGTLDKKSGSLVVDDLDTSEDIQWIYGRMIFDGQYLPEIAGIIERNYNVRIELADEELSSLRFYGDFIRQEQTLSEVLDALSATSKIRYENSESTIILYFVKH